MGGMGKRREERKGKRGGKGGKGRAPHFSEILNTPLAITKSAAANDAGEFRDRCHAAGGRNVG